jgi:crotonobetainyl-CoA:carnitine CoA-transferase CaiB-like acyl-CoA transferase
MSLLDSAVAIMGNQAMNYLTTGKAPGRMGNAHPNLTPYEVFECSDGHLIIATGNDGQYQRLCRLLGLDAMAESADYAKNADRVANRPAMISALNGATRLRTRDDLLATCEAHNVPAGPINDLNDVMADPQVRARGMQIDLDGVPGLRSPFRFSDAELALHRPAPKLGEDD